MSEVNATGNLHSGYQLWNESELATELGGDVNAKVAAMVLLYAHQNRQLAREARAAEETNLRLQERAQVAAMREEADEIREAGRCEAVSKGFAAAGQIGGGVTSFGGVCSENPAELTSIQGASNAISGFGELGGAVIHAESANHSGAAAEARAEAAEAEQMADASKRRLEQLRDEEQDAQDLYRDAIQFVRDVRETESNGERAAIFQRV